MSIVLDRDAKSIVDFAELVVALQRLLEEVESTNTRLILIVGAGHRGKTRLLQRLGEELKVAPLNVGLELGRRLSVMPVAKRALSTSEELRALTEQRAPDAPLLLDNLEVLFEPSLQVSPLDLLRKIAHGRRVIAVWPGECRGDRLTYAEVTHVEHRDDGRNGIVIFELFE